MNASFIALIMMKPVNFEGFIGIPISFIIALVTKGSDRKVGAICRCNYNQPINASVQFEQPPLTVINTAIYLGGEGLSTFIANEVKGG